MTYHSLLTTPSYTLRRIGDPFTVMQRLLDDTFGDTPAAAKSAPLSVRLDVREDEKAFHVMADLPGLSESEVEVTFDDGLLTIKGEKKLARDNKGDTWHVTERSYGRFERQMALSVNVDAEKIEAKFEKGVLSVTLPKQPAPEPSARKITIKTA